jgi:hypothetical protein
VGKTEHIHALRHGFGRRCVADLDLTALISERRKSEHRSTLPAHFLSHGDFNEKPFALVNKQTNTFFE